MPNGPTARKIQSLIHREQNRDKFISVFENPQEFRREHFMGSRQGMRESEGLRFRHLSIALRHSSITLAEIYLLSTVNHEGELWKLTPRQTCRARHIGSLQSRDRARPIRQEDIPFLIRESALRSEQAPDEIALEDREAGIID